MIAALVSVGVLTGGCAVAPSTTSPAVSTSPSASASGAGSVPVSPSPSSALSLPSLSGVDNFRDVAGSGLDTADGGSMATGVVFRSAKLSGATPSDVRALAGLGLVAVLDLRTPVVARRSPDPRIPGAKNQLINLFGVSQTTSVRLQSVAQAQATMRATNVAFVADPAQRRRLALALRVIAQARGPVLIHCSEGKDRTGWVSAVLQLTAGASADEVMAEYLASNRYRAGAIEEAYQATRANSGERAAQIQQATLKVEASYLQAGLDELTRRYGSIDGYLSTGVGLSDATIARLRQRLRA